MPPLVLCASVVTPDFGGGSLTIWAAHAKSVASTNTGNPNRSCGVAIERMRELRRRRSRSRKMGILKKKAAKANASEKAVIAMKLRRLTPGADVVIARLGLEER